MISFIIQEYKEDREFIEKMLQQISQVSHEKELVFVVGEPGVDMMLSLIHISEPTRPY